MDTRIYDSVSMAAYYLREVHPVDPAYPADTITKMPVRRPRPNIEGWSDPAAAQFVVEQIEQALNAISCALQDLPDEHRRRLLLSQHGYREFPNTFKFMYGRAPR